jgi:hypothetical protein
MMLTFMIFHCTYSRILNTCRDIGIDKYEVIDWKRSRLLKISNHKFRHRRLSQILSHRFRHRTFSQILSLDFSLV